MYRKNEQTISANERLERAFRQLNLVVENVSHIRTALTSCNDVQAHVMVPGLAIQAYSPYSAALRLQSKAIHSLAKELDILSDVMDNEAARNAR